MSEKLKMEVPFSLDLLMEYPDMVKWSAIPTSELSNVPHSTLVDYADELNLTQLIFVYNNVSTEEEKKSIAHLIEKEGFNIHEIFDAISELTRTGHEITGTLIKDLQSLLHMNEGGKEKLFIMTLALDEKQDPDNEIKRTLLKALKIKLNVTKNHNTFLARLVLGEYKSLKVTPTYQNVKFLVESGAKIDCTVSPDRSYTYNWVLFLCHQTANATSSNLQKYHIDDNERAKILEYLITECSYKVSINLGHFIIKYQNELSITKQTLLKHLDAFEHYEHLVLDMFMHCSIYEVQRVMNEKSIDVNYRNTVTGGNMLHYAIQSYDDIKEKVEYIFSLGDVNFNQEASIAPGATIDIRRHYGIYSCLKMAKTIQKSHADRNRMIPGLQEAINILEEKGAIITP